MSLLLENKLLRATEDKIESSLTPQNKQNYLKIVVSGLKVAMQNGPKSYMAQLHESKDPVSDCAQGAVAIVLILRKESRNTMPVQAMVPAAMTLMLHGLDFCDQSGLVKVDKNVIAKASHIFTNAIFKGLHISPQMINHAHGVLNQVTQQPGMMAKIRMKAGTAKMPTDAVPTPVPTGGK